MSELPDLARLIGRLRLRHLALLDQLGRDPNLGRSSKRLNMSQPTASKLLRDVEDVLGFPLFIRNRRGLTPTPTGQLMTRRARVLMGEMKATHAALEAVTQGATGRLRIGVFPVAVAAVLPDLYENLLLRWPGVQLTVEEAVESVLLAQLSAGKIDCIIGRVVLQALTPDLRHEALYNESTVVVCGTQHPVLRAKAQTRLDVLQSSSWMLPDSSGAAYNMVASWLAAHGADPPCVAIRTPSVFATIELLNRSALLSVLPKSVALIYARLAKVALVPDGDMASHYPVGIIYRASSTSNPIIEAVLAAFREIANHAQ